MKVLVVYAHPNPDSFNHAVLESFARGLEDGGHTFEISDLYGMKFNPSLGLDEVPGLAGGEKPPDVASEQAKITRAEALVFIFPIWWLTCPGILKGWMDRVLTHGFAFQITDKGFEGKLKHKKAQVICTAGSPEVKYNALGRTDSIKNYFNQALNIDCGIARVECAFFYGLLKVDSSPR